MSHSRESTQDGYDIVEFLARQPWSNGKISMWGGSYAGYDQWATLKEAPPHLATIVPVAAVHPGVDFPFFKGIFFSYDLQWLTFTSGVTPQTNLFGEPVFWRSKFREMFLQHVPFNQLDHIVGNASTVFQKWLEHPTPDDYWDAMVPTPEQYGKMNVPILTITGSYDGDQTGALSYYAEHLKYSNAKQQHYLIIGPWNHAGTRTPNRDVGGLKFGEASMLDLNKLHKDWWDWTLKGAAKPDFLKKPIAYYVIGPGAENWKYADNLDAIASEHRTWYLSSDGNGANDAFHSGHLVPQPPQSSRPDTYVYDPMDVRPVGPECEENRSYLLDQSAALNLFGNGLVYHSEPFAEASEISGYVKLSLWISMDVPDTDIAIGLYEIMSDGTSIALASDALRARYRENLRQEKLVTAGEVNRYDFTGFTWFSRRVSKGSRLRLLIHSQNSIYYEKNYNTGGVVAAESGKDARTAHITLYHDAHHPSALVIPVVR